PRYPVGLGTVSLSPLLQAKAFATFPNGGREVVPISVRFIEDRRGTEILNPAREVAQQLIRKGDEAQIISPQAAYIMTSILQSTVEFGTLRNRRLLVGGFGDMAMAGKTGTTQNWSDAWTVGFSPYMTTAVWLGFDRGGTNSLGTNQTGAQTAGPIWAWYMKEIHENLPPREFERPPGIVEVTITEKTGLLPTEDYRGATIDEIFIAGTEPTKFDTTEDFHDTQGTRIAAEYSRASPHGNNVADRLRELGLLSSSDRSSGGASTYQGSGNPFLDDTSSPMDREPEDPEAGPGDDDDDDDDENTTEDKPNPMLD
ncbi:MAG: penicillin-binding protein, partial [Spirochaetaceae bacterium]|nr:penicillin-binding protein [Spirochaetaceae bacterium]